MMLDVLLNVLDGQEVQSAFVLLPLTTHCLEIIDLEG